MMANNFETINNWEAWQGLTREQRDYELFRILHNLDRRLASLERRPWFDKGLAFCGGIFGGALAAVGIRKL